MKNLDQFSAALGAVIADASRQTVVTAQANAVVRAAATGGAAAVDRMLEGMSTAEIQAVKARLER